MKFSDMYLRVISEKYYPYKMPEDKSLTMYDFYVLDYLNSILEYPSSSFRDLPMDLVDSVKDAKNNLYPALREELLSAVFYAICAEIRHAEVHSGKNRQLAQDDPKYAKLYKNWLRYQDFHGKSMNDQDQLVDLYGVEKPSAKKRGLPTEANNDKRRNLSYKAANYAIEKTGLAEADFVEMCEHLYTKGTWASSYGGSAWAGICKGWLMLHNAKDIEGAKAQTKGVDYGGEKTEWDKQSDKSKTVKQSDKKPMSVAIDHIYDLQHNTDTVFNKLKSYYKTGYGWIKTALDDKANVKSYHELLSKCSGTVKAMALPVLYNKLGTTWEKEMKIESPKKEDTSTPDVTSTPDLTFDPKVGLKVGDSYVSTYNGYKFIIKDNSKPSFYVYDIYTPEGGVHVKDHIYSKEAVHNSLDSGEYEMVPKALEIPTVKAPRSIPLSNSPKFKVGDMVECIDTPNNSLILGEKYKVLSIDGDMIKIIDESGQEGGWFMNRFKLATPASPRKTKRPLKTSNTSASNFKVGDVVKCINAPVNKGVINGKEYTVLIAYVDGMDNFIKIKDESGSVGGWFSNRFELATPKTQKKNRATQTSTNPYITPLHTTPDYKVGG